MARKTPDTSQQEASRKGGLFGRGRNKDVPDAPKRGVFGRMAGAVGRVHGVFARANHWVIMGGLFTGIFGRMKGVKGIGGAFGFAERLFAGVDDATRAQAGKELPKQITVKELGGMLSPARGLKRILGNKGAQVQDGVGKVEGGIAGAVGKAARAVSGALGTQVENSRGKLIDPLVGRLDAGAARHAGKAQEILANTVSSSKGHAALGSVSSSLEQASAALKKGDNGTYVAAMEQAQKNLKDAAGSVDKGILKNINSGMKKAGSAAEKVGSRNQGAERLKGLPEAVRNAPETFKNANVRNVVMKGAMVTGTAMMVTDTTRDLSGNIGALKNLYFDLTGEKKISTRKLLFSKDVPNIVKEARGQLRKQFGPRVIMDVANTAATAAFAVMRGNGMSLKNGNMKLMVGNVGLMGLNLMYQAKAQESFLPIYDAFSQMPELEDAHYAALISTASKQAAQAGGVESPLVQALAVEYAREGLRPVEVLKEIDNGRFDERAMRIVQESRNAMGASHAEGHADGAAAVTEAERITASAADPAGAAKPLSREENAKLADMEAQFGKKFDKNREVMGIHTQRLRNESQGHAQSVKI